MTHIMGTIRRVALSCRVPVAITITGATAVLLCAAGPASASTALLPVPLHTANHFAVLAATAVTNTGPTVLTGNPTDPTGALGLSPGTAITGFPPGAVNGTIHTADSAAQQAQTDLTTAYNNAAGRPDTATIPTELGGTTLTAGVYNSAAGTFGIDGTVTLNAQGNPRAVFIFQAASTLITASASQVKLANGARAANVFWLVGSSATLGTDSFFNGNVIALDSITVTTGVTIEGRVLARTGAVTLDTDIISK